MSNSLVAIDFETANGSPSSVCSVGVVIVRDGEVVDSFYSLIHPYPDYYAWFCRQVHGLGPPSLYIHSLEPWNSVAPVTAAISSRLEGRTPQPGMMVMRPAACKTKSRRTKRPR